MWTPTIPCKFFLLYTWKVFATLSQVRHRSLVRRKIKLKGGKRLKRETRSPPSLRRRTASHQNSLHGQYSHQNAHHDQNSHQRAHRTKLSREVCAAVGFQDVCAMARAARWEGIWIRIMIMISTNVWIRMIVTISINMPLWQIHWCNLWPC